MSSLCHQTKVQHHIKYRVIIYLQRKNRPSYEGTKIHSVLSTGTHNLALKHPKRGLSCHLHSTQPPTECKKIKQSLIGQK